MATWFKTLREQRRKAKREASALIRIVDLLKEDDAHREQQLGELSALYHVAQAQAQQNDQQTQESE